MKIYKSDEPQFIGQFSVRQDIEVLSADEFDQREVDFITKTYCGNEIYKSLEKRELLTKIDDVAVGDTVFVQFISGDYMQAIVTELPRWGLCAETEFNIYILEFGKDDRNCWICPQIINKKILHLFK